MAHALALDSQQIALDLLLLLKDLDPVRWRDELEEVFRQRLLEMQAQIEELQRRMVALCDRPYADEATRALRDGVNRVAGIIHDYAPDSGLAEAHLREQWMELRTRLHPAYDALAASLRLQDIHVPALRPTNYLRNAFHITASVTALLLVETLLGATSMLVAASLIAACAWTMEISRRYSTTSDRFSWWLLGRMAHPHERTRVNSATWFSSALFLLALTGSHLIAALALGVLGLADPVAALVGRRWGRHTLVHGRTVEGSLAFIVAGSLVTSLTLLTWHRELGGAAMVLLVASAVLPASLAELFARRIDDNLLVPLAAAAGSGLVATLLGLL